MAKQREVTGWYAIIADGELDQITETDRAAKRVRSDLLAMGCSVSVKRFATYAEAEAYGERLRGR